MQTSTACLPCFLRQTRDAARLLHIDGRALQTIEREILRLLLRIDMLQPPPVMAQTIRNFLRTVTQIDDPYAAEKKQCNAFALRLLPELDARVRRSPDPIAAAVRLAVAGNIIDLGVGAAITQDQMSHTIQSALDTPLDPAALDRFQHAVLAAKTILYLGDNTGEIVLDRLLIETLIRAGLDPAHITFAVRGKPILNDALIEDARDTGLADLVRVIDNGSGVPGTWLPDCSPAFRDQFVRADLIISKGQGNYETLDPAALGPAKPTFYMLKIKCAVVSAQLALPIGTPLLLTANQ